MRITFCAMTLMTFIFLMSGCHSSEAFHASIQKATRNISDGRLDAARLEVAEADQLASNSKELRKVSDLNLVLDGAEAMIQGDPTTAVDSWSGIQNDSLRMQLEKHARSIGISVNSNQKEQIR